jgi:hypothetical protein
MESLARRQQQRYDREVQQKKTKGGRVNSRPSATRRPQLALQSRYLYPYTYQLHLTKAAPKRMYSHQQLSLEEGHYKFGHYDHLDSFADAQQVVQIGSDSQPLVDHGAVIGTVSRPPIQKPVYTPSRTLSPAIANKAPVSGTAISTYEHDEVILPSNIELEHSEGKRGRMDMT